MLGKCATFQEKDLVSVIGRVVAREVPGVWPTRSHARWLFDQFQSSELLDGLSLRARLSEDPVDADSVSVRDLLFPLLQRASDQARLSRSGTTGGEEDKTAHDYGKSD